MPIAVWLVALVGPLVKKAMLALGIGVVSYAGFTLLANQVRDQVLAHLSGLTGDAYQIIAMSGAFEAIGILLGGLAAKATLMAIDRFQRIVTTP